MASSLSTFPQPHLFRSPLVKHQPESVPSIDELEHLQSELRVAQQRATDRHRKAVDDVRIIEESIRRMTEKEKGKSRAVDKVKRERDYTPLPDGDDTTSLRSSLDPRRFTQEDKKKKKKRKREPGDSEGEPGKFSLLIQCERH